MYMTASSNICTVTQHEKHVAANRSAMQLGMHCRVCIKTTLPEPALVCVQLGHTCQLDLQISPAAPNPFGAGLGPYGEELGQGIPKQMGLGAGNAAKQATQK